MGVLIQYTDPEGEKLRCNLGDETLRSLCFWALCALKERCKKGKKKGEACFTLVSSEKRKVKIH